MSNAWDHLPNAKYFDSVLTSMAANPGEWAAATFAGRWSSWDKAWDAARDATRPALWAAVFDAARGAALGNTWSAARSAARNAIAALVAWDDCSHMLDSAVDDLRILSKLGDHRATLLIPAAAAFKLIREKQVTVDTTL